MTSEFALQILVLLGAMIASGCIGFWIARDRYRVPPTRYEGHKPLPKTARMAPSVQ